MVSNCSSESKKENEEVENITSTPSEFIGDESCVSCHQQQHEDWHNSHHDWAMKTPNDSTVLGAFDNRSLKMDGVQYKFYKLNNEFWVDVQEKNEKAKTHKIEYTFGFDPLQQYLIQGENGEVHTLRASWDTKNKKWYHQYAGDVIAPDNWLHWQKGGQRWNTMCASCHSTDLQKNYAIENRTFKTTFKTINVGCESCHGKGSNHVNWAKNGASGDPQIFKPKDQTSILNQCAPCHARRARITHNAEPGSLFSDHFLVQTLNPSFYELDGQIKEEDYVFGSFLSSKMYQEGVKCNDCHDPHSLKLKAEGNNLCLSCHEPEYNSKNHHKHELGTSGSECVNCHMTGKNYMGHDFRRDHSFRIPRPDQSLKFGTSNACTGCHEDKTDKWAAKRIEDWYGPVRKAHFSDYLLLSSKETLNPEESKSLVDFVNNKEFPEIARATVVEALQNKISNQDFAELIQNIDEKEGMVLNSVLNLFMQESGETRLYLARKHIFNQHKIVRITATKLLLDVPKEQFNSTEIQQLNKNEKELWEMLEVGADFPVGRLQMGDYFFRKGDFENARKHYEVALDMDYMLTPVYSNLATTYNILKQNDLAVSTLNKGIEVDPENGQLNYLLGILQYEMGEKDNSIANLNRSISKDPSLVNSYYNLAVIYYESKNLNKAESILLKGLKSNPSNPRLEEFLNLILSQKS